MNLDFSEQTFSLPKTLNCLTPFQCEIQILRRCGVKFNTQQT